MNKIRILWRNKPVVKLIRERREKIQIVKNRIKVEGEIYTFL
jgi:hypothetical protein